LHILEPNIPCMDTINPSKWLTFKVVDIQIGTKPYMQ
jgi:hypothetical protein